MRMGGMVAMALAAIVAQGGDLAHAASWFQWTSPDGRTQLSRNTPPLGVPYVAIAVPDPIRWSNPPSMPEARQGAGALGPQGLFKLAASSVYWVVRKPAASGGADASALVYGSAVAISDELAITNCHVVAGESQSLVMGSALSGEQSNIEIVGAQIDDDRCVVRARGMRLVPVTGIRRFDTLEIGEPVYAIGNPKRMELTLSDGLLSGRRQMGDLRRVQTTAPISPGSSGGGLFDSQGNLVGITTSTLRDAQAINFAIPAEDFWK